MVRSAIVVLGFAFLAATGGLAGRGLPAGALVVTAAEAGESPAVVLERALLLPELYKVMQKEGLAYGKTIESQFFPGSGGASWQAEVGRIYAPEHLGQLFHDRFALALRQGAADTQPMVAFFASDLGRRAVALELSARQALLDKDIEAGAWAALDRLEAEGDPRLQMIRGYLEANHVIDLNVASALNANVAFLTALSEAAEPGQRMSRDEILAQVAGGQEAARADAERWILGFSVLAYAPLSDTELRAYMEFAETPAGLALNKALFEAYDEMFARISADLGRSVGRWMAGTNL